MLVPHIRSTALRKIVQTSRSGVLRQRNCPYATVTPFFQGEVAQPTVRTEIPGPIAKWMRDDLDDVFDTRSLNMLVDYKKSYGN